MNASDLQLLVDAPLHVHEEWRDVRRVLAIRLDNLGDVLVTTPAIHAMRESLPDAAITLLASPVGAQAGRLNPDLADIVVYNAPWMDPWSRLPLDPAREMQAIAQLSAGRYDAAVIFSSFRQSPLPAAYLCYLAGIPLRLAASIDGPGSLLTTRHRHPERMMHEVERGLDLVAAVGMRTRDDRLVLRVPDGARDEIAGLVAGQRPLIVVHPGCSMPARTYPWEQYVEVVDLLVRDLGARVVLTGGDDERPLVDADPGSYRPLEPHSGHGRGRIARLPRILRAGRNRRRRRHEQHRPHAHGGRPRYSRGGPLRFDQSTRAVGTMEGAPSHALARGTVPPLLQPRLPNDARLPAPGGAAAGGRGGSGPAARERTCLGASATDRARTDAVRIAPMSAGNPWLAARNLLAVRLDNAGDVVMLGPALRAIKTTSPECQITLLASPAGAKAAPLLPWIDSVLVWRSIWQDLGQLPFDPARENELIQLLAGRAFDAAVIFSSFSQTPHVAAYVCYLAGIPLRAGESKEFGGATLSTELRGTPDATHQVDRNLHLVRALGFSEVDPALEIAIPDASREEVARRLWDVGIGPDQPLALLHPGRQRRGPPLSGRAIPAGGRTVAGPGVAARRDRL